MQLENLNQARPDFYLISNELNLNQSINLFKTRSSTYIVRKLSCSTIDTNVSSSSETIKNNINLEHLLLFDNNDIIENLSNEINEKDKLRYKYELFNNILNQRKKSAIKIANFIKSKVDIIKIKKQFLIQKIIDNKINLIIKIQKHIRGFLIKKSINNILNCEYVLFYRLSKELIEKLNYKNLNDSYNNMNKQNIVQCKIFSTPFDNKKYTFIYCKFLNCYYLPLINIRILKRKYKINFIINNQTIIDSRYQVDIDNKGNFYNIIMKNMIFRFKKGIKEMIEYQEKKYWESIFEIKKKIKRTNSYDSLSISNSNISNENYTPIYESEMSNKSNLKPILKNSLKKIESFGDKKEINKRKVSFNKKIVYSY